MVRRIAFFSLVIVVVLAGMIGVSPEAQSSVGSTSQKGSLLIFPDIYTGGSWETIVMIGNDSSSSVTVKCYWMDDAQSPSDFEFQLTPNQPVWFRATTGQGSIDVAPLGQDMEGELRCWAVDISTDPESLRPFNSLYGSVMQLYFDSVFPSAFEYKAWAFGLRGAPANPSGPLVLAGTANNYDACPAYLVYNFFADGGSALDTARFGRSYLALTPCQQDLRQDRGPICTKAKFDVWNENENKFTGAYECLKCWVESQLELIGQEKWLWTDVPGSKVAGFGGEKFSRAVLHTDAGRFRVTPSTFPACTGVFVQYDLDGTSIVDYCAAAKDQYLTPLLGVMITEVSLGAPPPQNPNAYIGDTGSSGGAWQKPTNPGFAFPSILWDAGAGAATAAKR
jgi:hypothetical protein